MNMKSISSFIAKSTFAIGLITSSAHAAEVELLEAFNVSMSFHGQTSVTSSFSVVVDNISNEKNVSVHRERDDGTWVDIPMYFYGPAGNGKEIWKVNSSLSSWGDEFAVKMEVNGSEFWDNNAGNNYQILSQGYLLGDAKEVTVASWSTHEVFQSNDSRLFAKIVVDNIGVSKNIQLVYSFDGWNTSTAVDATFDGNRAFIGRGSYPNPSLNNAESWSAGFEFPKGLQGEFYIKYSVNGVDYFDNNFGSNYRINPPTTFPSMHLRAGPSWSQGRPMTAIDDNLWATEISVSEPFGITAIKFDVFNDWATNFGDSNLDGFAESFGGNIPVPAPGSYRVFFNDQTLEYTFQPFGFIE